MAVIELQTEINAPSNICFDLARSIDLHKLSTSHTKEIAIAGVTSGLIGLDEEVTWEATHFGIRQRLTSRITAFTYGRHFRDEMTKGIFKLIKHDHIFFENKEGTTVMKDVFEFESPFGYIGKFLNSMILTSYLKKLMIKRNELIKHTAESSEWKKFLSISTQDS